MVLSEFRSGDDILTRNEGGWVGDRVEKRQLDAGIPAKSAEYTHIETILIPPYSLRVAPPKARVVDFVRKYQGKYIRIVRYKGYEESSTKHKDVSIWLATKRGHIYDFPGVISFILPFLKQISSWYFCSEMALWAKQKIIPSAYGGMRPSKCMPAHAFKYSRVLFEGQMF